MVGETGRIWWYKEHALAKQKVEVDWQRLRLMWKCRGTAAKAQAPGGQRKGGSPVPPPRTPAQPWRSLCSSRGLIWPHTGSHAGPADPRTTAENQHSPYLWTMVLPREPRSTWLWHSHRQGPTCRSSSILLGLNSNQSCDQRAVLPHGQFPKKKTRIKI